MTFCFPKSLQDTESLHKSMLITDINIFFFKFLLLLSFFTYISLELRETRGSKQFSYFNSKLNDVSRPLKDKDVVIFQKKPMSAFFNYFSSLRRGGLVKRELLNLTFFLVKRKSYKGLISQRPQYKRSVKHCMYCQTVGKFTKHVRTGFP